MTLDGWMRRGRVDDEDLATRLEPLIGRKVHFYTVVRWRRLMTIPPRDVIAAVAHLTAFAVLPADWYPEVAAARAGARRERRAAAQDAAVPS